MYKLTLCILCCFVALVAYSQTETDIQLAQHYYLNGEFSKAVVYYEKLYTNDPSKVYFSRYLDCLVNIGDKKGAEKVFKKQTAANPGDLSLKIQFYFFYKNNEELLNQLILEKIELEHKGYQICFLGDFNARISPDSRFDFRQYPHAPNNNGALVNNFANTINLHCMNPMSWNGLAEEHFTYQRDLGIRYDRSIIDYGIGTPGAISLTACFTVQVNF